MSFSPLGDALKKRLDRNQPLKNQVEAALVVEEAERVLGSILGADNAGLAKALFLKNKTLTITCSTSAIAQEVRLNQAAIVAAINEKIGQKVVDRIRYLA